MNDPSAEAKLDELIDQFETAMLVTTSLQGEIRARPMAIADHRPGGALYFATHSEDEKLKEILHSNQIAVTMQKGNRYLSLTGDARIETDLVLADELWSPTMRLWFPAGPKDPHLTLLIVTPNFAEYWDRSGVRGLEFLWEASRALLKGTNPPDDALTGHAKIDLAS